MVVPSTCSIRKQTVIMNLEGSAPSPPPFELSQLDAAGAEARPSDSVLPICEHNMDLPPFNLTLVRGYPPFVQLKALRVRCFPSVIRDSMGFSSIQTFYKKEIQSSSPQSPPSRQAGPVDQGPNAAFTPTEVDAVLRPLAQIWRPKGTYQQVNISDLQLGPGNVRFTGRIVNFAPSKDTPGRSILPQGFHFLVVKDDTGVVTFSSSSSMSGLMKLKAYLNSGHDGVPGARVLVCVSSVGPRKMVKLHTGGVVDLVDTGIFDETANCVLKLWRDKVQSARDWIPNQTVLLITDPKCRPAEKKAGIAELSIGITSMVEIDPAIRDADWLRTMASNRTKKEAVYIPFPTGLWDTEAAKHGSDRTLFNLADVDDFARESADTAFTGKLNLVILDVKIMVNRRQDMLCCFQW
ncbi:hypothetical protein B0H66DRAFT_616635 [Apodospora peruviana]|uniref:Uncharacterized protein n=1 Tax=Apodospora peruviana TaxID=516989 RepID=A0AAE0IJ33_9PEZI|nr:hypothetical protein B0H66DRAFT_616635 [Apodospora peruviana]